MYRSLLTSLAVLLTVGTAAAQSAWKSDDDIIFLHRGGRLLAPEGSMEAVIQAYRMGADGIEVDLRATRDGVVVNYHDDDTFIKGRGFLPIERMTYDELCELDCGGWFDHGFDDVKIAKFEDILRFCLANDFYLRVELKTPEIKIFVDELLERYDAWRLIGSSVGGEYGDREVFEQPWLNDKLWNEGGEEDPHRLASLIADAKTPFRVNVDDARVLCDLLDRRPERRELKDPVAAIEPPKMEKPTFEWLLQTLKGSNVRMSRYSVVGLLWWHAQRSPQIIDALYTESGVPDHAHVAGTWVLGHFEKTKQVEKLIVAALGNKNPEVRAMAAYAAARQGLDVGNQLQGLFQRDKDPSVRAAAAWSIGRLGAKRHANKLMTYVGRHAGRRVSSDIRTPALHAVLALGKLEHKPALNVLVKSLQGDNIVGLAAMHALADLGGPKAVAALAAFIEKKGLEGKPHWVATHLAFCLSRLKAWERLARSLETDDPFMAREAVYTLIRAGDDAVPAVVNALKSRNATDLLRKRAAVVLRYAGKKSVAVRELKKLARSKNVEVREVAAWALWRRGDLVKRSQGPLDPRKISRARRAAAKGRK